MLADFLQIKTFQELNFQKVVYTINFNFIVIADVKTVLCLLKLFNEVITYFLKIFSYDVHQY